MQTVHTINLVATDPSIRSGRPFILGTTVTVHDIAMAKLYHALDAEGISEWYGLSLPQVYAGLAFYYDHKTEVDEQIRTQIKKAESLKEQRLGSQDSLLS